MSDFHSSIQALSNLEGKILSYPVYKPLEGLLLILVQISSHSDIIRKRNLDAITAATNTLRLELDDLIHQWKLSRDPDNNLDDLLV